MKNIVSFLLLTIIFLVGFSFSGNKKFTLTKKVAINLSKLPLKCIHKEFPNKPSHVMNGPFDILSPRKMHPAFYGCFDCHSSVG